MALQIESRRAGMALVLDLAGRLTAGAGVEQLRQAIRKLADEGSTNLLLNMSELEFMDSAGLSALVVGADLVRNRGGLRILNARGPVRHVLQITRLDRVLLCFESEETALASFAS